jgi:rhamnosyltransferase
MNEIAGVVILYYPDENEIIKNINSYLPYIELLIVIENTEIPSSEIRKNIEALSPKILYINMKSNKGISLPLNIAASIAHEKKFYWLLTMDQDSFFDDLQLQNYLSYFFKYFYQNKEIGIIGPSQDFKKNSATPFFSYVPSLITSGSLVQINSWKQSGGFDEKLVIDEVDHEFCYRIQLLGYKVVQFNHIEMSHRLGTNTRSGYLGIIKKRNRIIHSPKRIYFIVRNYMYVRKKYKNSFPLEFKKRDFMFLTILKNNLLFSGRFLKTLSNAWKGYKDFTKENFSKSL